MNPLIETLNHLGEQALQFAWAMFWQSSLLILVLFAIDLVLQRWARAAVRHALWLVLILKLMLPPSLALPTGAGWWLRPAARAPTVPAAPAASFVSDAIPTTAAFVVQEAPPPASQPIVQLSSAAVALLGSSAVSLALIVFMLVRWRQAARLAQEAMAAPEWLDQLLAEARHSLKLRPSVRVRLTNQIASPSVCGLVRPTILLPRLLVERLSPAQLRAVLLHELFHLRRGDVWVNCSQALLQALYWWHPLLWLANSRIRRVREEAVDDAVMLALKGEAEAYAPTLLRIARFAVHRPLATLGLVGILESKKALRQRLERLVNCSLPKKAGLSFVSVFSIASFAAVALPMGEAPAKPSIIPQTETKPLSETGLAEEQKSRARDNAKSQPNVGSDAESVTVAQLTPGDAPNPHTGEPRTNSIHPVNTPSLHHSLSGNGRQEIASKLQSIRLDSVEFDNVPLSEIIVFLGNEAKNRDPQGRGINFLLSANINPALTAPTTIDPSTGLPVQAAPAPEPVDVGAILIKIKPHLLDVTLQEVLDAIVRVADTRIRYSIENYAVVFSLRTGQEPAPLYTRVIRVDPNTFRQGLESVIGVPFGGTPGGGSGGGGGAGLPVPRVQLPPATSTGGGAAATSGANGGASIQSAIRQFFIALGVDSFPPSVLYYDETEGTLLVHAPLKDVEVIEAAIGSLNTNAPQMPKPSGGAVETNPPASNHATNSSGAIHNVPVLGDVPLVSRLFRSESGAPSGSNPPPSSPQVSIRARFVTVIEKDLRALGFDWYSGKSQASSAAHSQANPQTVTAILSDDRFRADFHRLEQRKGTDILAPPSVTTLSGREALIQVADSKTAVNGIKWSLPQTPDLTQATTTNSLAATYLTDSVLVGPKLDVIPSVAADGSTIQLRLTPTVLEFLGYDPPSQQFYEDNHVLSETKRPTLPLPHFRLRTMQAEAEVRDGQTLVLASPKIVDVAVQPTPKSPTKPGQKEKILLVFVTATLLDPAGNPVHNAPKSGTSKPE
jgi:beta-lactamase regulating signal transducer with metallopeptidase domain